MTVLKTNHNRRSFLKVSTLAGGGMVLGFSWLAGCKPEADATAAETMTMPEEWFDINGFLKIGDNGIVTIMSPNPEIGQNVKTAMPMIVAEELDVDWKDVVVEQAGLDTENFSRQVAGGSQSIRQGWKSLRMAGATARRMLLEAAAQQWEVPLSELTTASGRILHEASGRSIGYGEVASAAAGIEVPEEIELKAPQDFKIIGVPTKNVDGRKIATGAPLFGLDYEKEGMLIAMAQHAPAFGMKLRSMNIEAAKAMPGIVDVFKIETKPEGMEHRRLNNLAFSDLVAVVGRSTWEVMKAKEALELEWEVDTPGETTDLINNELDKLLATGVEEPSRKDGDPEAAFRNAAQVIERTYSGPFLAHNTMEPMNFFAHVTADRAELAGPVQTPAALQNMVSVRLNIPEENVSVMMTRMGGGFGRRLYGHFGVEAALISQQVNAPVKLIYSRADDMTQGTYRPSYKVTYRAALDADNKLIGFHVKGTGAHESPVFSNRYPAGTVDNYLAENNSLESNITSGAWRAPRSNFIAFAEQSFLDEVAEAAGKDPIDFRLELFERASSDPVGEKNDYDPERYAGVLKLVKEKAGWGSEKAGVHRGVSAYFCHNSYVAQVVDVVMNGNKPSIEKVWCAVDCGIVVNPEGALNQIEGGIVDGIGHALYGRMSFREGRPEQSNFDTYRLIRHSEAPKAIEVFFVDNGIDPTGLGEPSLPPVAAALANALARATGERLYSQPFVSDQDVLG
ncbi:xanthine dehydrogenase family protein molybdopterin-binding subunit [Flavilitoribacter nigricans]|uniref:Isoquinoline 1-oxidoreductase n=1 Tax=Flavilitoribacter nigricans (strain ATCC 23147 / DSM 23189 / NBRC 102662 / NCIMB 1420 / SS-2) TaxID=1122177 RepID=A0A2D0NES9_FLAN2|nr:molybdopterin cofactor-binding domain-containing protein [Flavilitoribacter nigricans]PHN07024.1 isoquinoline 1-oxidoreductase [Flavilitoribacter nigricans DSM 23189 = NBRC 102662]